MHRSFPSRSSANIVIGSVALLAVLLMIAGPVPAASAQASKYRCAGLLLPRVPVDSDGCGLSNPSARGHEPE